MNERVNNFLLAGDKTMPEMHLNHPGFTYSTCGHLLKTKREFKNRKKTGGANYFYKSELDKACFQNDMAYGE